MVRMSIRANFGEIESLGQGVLGLSLRFFPPVQCQTLCSRSVLDPLLRAALGFELGSTQNRQP